MKRFILWDYPRAGWQYDLMVGVILAFIFLTPREWFRDQPRASSIVMLPAEHGTNVYWLEPDLLLGLPEESRFAHAAELLKSQRRLELVRLEPIFDAEEEVRGFMAYTRR
ncbi:MAG TPA: hypothetical protein DEH78_06290 [Solibacterales bacterium]|nr:hypothetical protein [Bryobacterales bacterium]